MARGRSKSGGKAKGQPRKLGVKKQAIKDLAALEGTGSRVKGGIRATGGPKPARIR
ncbi:MAG TPA: hypothetical protein VIG69_10770 [Candidatus Methylomirabilis sp.]|jgi:hypothetical protein